MKSLEKFPLNLFQSKWLLHSMKSGGSGGFLLEESGGN